MLWLYFDHWTYIGYKNFVCFLKQLSWSHYIYFNLDAAAVIVLMESSRGQNGIQALLSAEQEAQHIVNAARTGNSSLILKFLFFWLLWPWSTLLIDSDTSHNAVSCECISIVCFELNATIFMFLLYSKAGKTKASQRRSWEGNCRIPCTNGSWVSEETCRGKYLISLRKIIEIISFELICG